jgi:tetratricopeptide (TPR) repeat protein
LSQNDREEMQGRRDFLISYTSQDQPWAEWIAAQLDAAGYTFFFQAWDFRPGTNFIAEMDNATKLADRTLLVLSAAYLASSLAFSEWATALHSDPRGSQRRLLPVRIERCNVSGLLAQIGYLDLVGSNLEQAKERLLQGVQQGRVRPDHIVFPGSRETSLLLPSSLPALWNLPFVRNPFFTGRDDLLARLHTYLHATQTTALRQPVALSGLGGVGKTQVAIEYAYRYSSEYQAVLWVRAETIETLNASYTEIARTLQQDTQEQSKIVQMVKAWLETQRGWLLLLDNADDLTTVQPFLPARSSGHTLLMTRTQMIGKFARRLEVETLDAEVGALLLLRRAGLIEPDAASDAASPSDHSLALTLTESLGGLPLALDQAGAYIEETRCSLLSYSQQYQICKATLLARRGIASEDHPEPVTTTWSLSLQKIEEQNPIAIGLLRICVFLAPDAIPEELLREALQAVLAATQAAETRQNGTAVSPPISSVDFDEAIVLLRMYSLVQRNSQNQTLSIHHLVQTVMREAMTAGETRVWAQRTLQAVQKKLPENVLANRQHCERYLPHAQVCVQLAPESMGIERAAVSDWIGTYLLDRRRTEEAEWYIQLSLRLYEKHLGSNHPAAAVSLERVARSREMQDRFADAEILYLRALEISEQQAGVEHPFTATCLNHLAGLYFQQGRFGKAQPLQLRALTIREQQLGATHPDTALSLHNLAAIYRAQGQLAEAEALYLRALSIYEQLSQSSGTDMARSLSNLAGLYYEQGRFADARPLYVRVLAIYEQQLDEHSDIASCLNNLAALYRAQGRFEESEPLYLRALAIREQQLGADHPDTALSLNNLAALYRAQGRFEEAEPLYLRALAIRERHLGAAHLSTASCLNNLAGLYYQQGRFAEAEPLYLRALAIHEQHLGTEHPSTASCLNNLAALYRALGRFAEAEPLYLRTLAIHEQHLGATHPDTALTLNNLATLYRDQGRFTDAEPLYVRTLAIREQHLGAEHPSTATCLNNLATIYRVQGRFADAEPLYVRALAIRERHLGAEHPSTATCLNNLATLYWVQGRFADAEPLYVRALAIREQHLGAEHPSTVNCLNYLVRFHAQQGQLVDVRSVCKRALAISERVLGPLHPGTRAIRANYISLLKAGKQTKPVRPRWLRWL